MWLSYFTIGIGLSLKIGLMLGGAGAPIDAGTDGSISTDLAMPIVALLFVIYGAAGGMSAAITDYTRGTNIIFHLFFYRLCCIRGGINGKRVRQ